LGENFPLLHTFFEKFVFLPPVFKMLGWGKPHFQAELADLALKLKLASECLGTEIKFFIFR
jgi:hypothetical protein